ncbi:SgcJ/EcaC family oxidoreductase [Nocardia cyriacigeorgica]|uniref:SgcJ/EcaC family oxidoreductase n=1 Tax=Nocardia cyriacigeorgica TaxID=135487 RepID=UPI0018940A86|nr:SgcJ/EcaC family oxidoreductase [Nocardia cyriacigeorgica]MBF6085908.1 SgcJ/EcaC family oxidoreductase [Nocardia cyriacigeorgica]MBF6091998.1 SgcJ/EcaC family oxidoreductase [Nocardia cyriacigeorgica]MBF6394354.1 SgcJ/EcaC family oxidoreductase [Nocardia cyriacigeorgica]MBF6399989.1 SgcJ/EcaC family oxidoreductase [Nocardia cyriacigeorgica]MBF6495219.1 SgcJ/EcaC family oxidoreductase [Nocardia cyriacigeorgica]
MSIRDIEAPVVEDSSVDHAADREAIEAIVATVAEAYNTKDAELMVRDVAANAVVGNAVGVLHHGRDAVLEASRIGLAGFLKDEYVRYEVTDIGFLRPDVAIAHKAARAVTADGEPIDVDPAMVALYVLVKEDGRWWIAARQNTLVPQAG